MHRFSGDCSAARYHLPLPPRRFCSLQRRSSRPSDISYPRACPPDLRGVARVWQAPSAVSGSDHGGQEGISRGADVCCAHEYPRGDPGKASTAPGADARVRPILATGNGGGFVTINGHTRRGNDYCCACSRKVVPWRMSYIHGS